MTKSANTVVDCCECGKKLRVPSDRGRITFNCPGCNAQLDWAPAPTAADVEMVSAEPATLEASAVSQQATTGGTQKDEVNPWGDIMVAIILALITLFLIGVFELNNNEPFFYIILVIGGFLSLFSLCSGIKRLLQRIFRQYSVSQPNASLQADTTTKSISRWRRKDEEGKSALNYLTSLIFYISFIAGITWFFGNTMLISIVNTLAGIAIIYVLYKAIKVFSNTDTGGAVGLTFMALFILGTLPGLIIALLPESGVNFGLDTLFAGTDPVMENSHFKDVKVENTTPSDLDDLMEGWE